MEKLAGCKKRIRFAMPNFRIRISKFVRLSYRPKLKRHPPAPHHPPNVRSFFICLFLLHVISF